MYKFTVFTSTHNRAHTIKRVYDSLCNQTFRDFEWIVIDNGSTDNTKELVEKWQSQADFPICYIWQENKGKWIAINRAVQLAQGEFFLIADSDDAFVANSLERLNYHWESIPIEDRENFVGITCHCVYEDGTLVGNLFPNSPFDSNSEEMFYRYKKKGEKWGFNRTEVLKLYPFPNLIFCGDSYIWFRIARKYKTRYVNERLRIYYQDAGNQLSRRSPFKAAEGRIFYADALNFSANWMKYALFRFWKTAIHYIRFCVLTHDNLYVQQSRLRKNILKILWLSALIPGYLLALRDIYRYKIRKNS